MGGVGALVPRGSACQHAAYCIRGMVLQGLVMVQTFPALLALRLRPPWQELNAVTDDRFARCQPDWKSACATRLAAAPFALTYPAAHGAPHVMPAHPRSRPCPPAAA